MNQLVLGFDYDALDATTRAFVLEKRDHINLLARRSAEDIIAIGQDLIAVKAKLDHGQFLPWIDAEFGWGKNTAERFIGVAKAFRQNPQPGEFEAPALYALSSGDVSDAVRKEFVDRAAAGELITYRLGGASLGP